MRPHLLLRFAKFVFLISVVVFLFLGSYLSYQQYHLWKAGALSKYFLPPYQGISYFISYAFTNFFFKTLIALVASIIGLVGMRILNKKHGERFFEPVEYYLFASGILLVGHPWWTLYVALVFAVALLAAVGYLLISRKKEIAKKESRLYCCICIFSFEEHYGDIGKDYIETHHVIPVSELKEDCETHLEDIVLVCSNCHRILHRKRPWLGADELKSILKSRE